jgi:hypothetical protein
MNQKLKKPRNKYIRALPERVEDRATRKQKVDWTFKSNNDRENNAVALFNRRPISLNEGNYRVSYDPIDAKVPAPSL